MKLRILGALSMLLLNTISVSEAQTKYQPKTDAHITGHVVDAQTQEHIPFATITIKGSTIASVSDATGHFLIKNLPLGRHTIVTTITGYHPHQEDVTVQANRTIEVKMNLKARMVEIDQVVVSGSRNETNKRISANIVNVVSSKLFDNTSSNNVAEVLNFQSGLRVEYSCSNCGVPQLRINGLEGQYSQILLDSRPIFSSLATVYGLEQMPSAMIERVEVIRGGGSALFGSNAIGGVVNIITKEPLRNSATLSNVTNIMQGGAMDINTNLNASFVSDDNKAGLYMFGMIKDRNSYDRNGDGFSEIPKVNSETIGFRGYYKLTPSSRLTAEYHHIREFRRGGNLIEGPPHEADIAEQLRHNINGGGVKYDLYSKDYKHRMNIYTSLQNIDRESYFGTDKNPDAYGTTKDFTIIAGGQYTRSMDRFLFMPSDLTFGVEYSNNYLDDKMLGYNKSIQQRSIVYGTFLQNEWKNEKLSILIGGRLDKHNKITNPIFSPRFNLRYTPVSQVGLRVSYASGYRAAQAYDEDLHVAAVGGQVAIISIAPNLRPEYSHSLSGSVDLYHNFGSIEANLLIEGFYTDLNDVFKLQEIGYDSQGNLLMERRNASGATIRGVNLELKIGLSPKVVLDGGFTFQSSQYKRAEKWSENPDIEPQKQMLRSPDTYGYVSLNYMPFKQFSATFNASYTGSMIVPHHAGYISQDVQTKTPDFWDLGLRLAYDISLSSQVKLQINAGVKNALNSFQRDLDQGSLRDAKYIYGPSMPRTYYIGLKLSI